MEGPKAAGCANLEPRREAGHRDLDVQGEEEARAVEHRTSPRRASSKKGVGNE